MFVEDTQVVIGVAGQLDDGGHGEKGAGGGDGLPAAGFEFLQRGGHDEGAREAVVLPQLARR